MKRIHRQIIGTLLCSCLLVLAGCRSAEETPVPTLGPTGQVQFYFDPKSPFQPNVRISRVIEGKEHFVDSVRFVGFHNGAGIPCRPGPNTFAVSGGTMHRVLTVNVVEGKTTPIRIFAKAQAEIGALGAAVPVTIDLTEEPPIPYQFKP